MQETENMDKVKVSESMNKGEKWKQTGFALKKKRVYDL